MNYFMDHGVLVTYGAGRVINHAAVFSNSSEEHSKENLGFILNNNRVPPQEVVTEFKEISELLDGREWTHRFDPEHTTKLLDELNWAGYAYTLNSSDPEQPTVMFINRDEFVDLAKWTEVSTQKALELINKFTEPKVEE